MSETKQPRRIIAIRQPFALFDARPWRPALNVYETGTGVQILAELAGISLADLHVHVHSTSVLIHGTRHASMPEGLRRVQRMEIAAGPFQVEVPLPAPADPDRAEARYVAGILEVWVPLAEQPRQRVVVIRIDEGGTR